MAGLVSIEQPVRDRNHEEREQRGGTKPEDQGPGQTRKDGVYGDRGGRKHGLDERRWLGSNEDSATYILIYAGKCAFISRDAKGAPVGVIIENKMIYETQRVIFLRLWKLLY